MKSLQDLIFGKEFRQGASEAVREAVARADAAGLPKAYLDSYDQLHRDQPTQSKKVVNER